MFSRSARIYDAVYSYKDYAAEVVFEFGEAQIDGLSSRHLREPTTRTDEL